MATVLNFWRPSRIDDRDVETSRAFFGLGKLLGNIECYAGLTAEERAGIIATGYEFELTKKAFDRYFISHDRTRERDAAQCLVMFTSIALGLDGEAWSEESVRDVSEGLCRSMDQAPDEFIVHNLPLMNGVAERIHELYRAVL